MKPQSSVSIGIERPCLEKWANMEAGAEGRLCGLCNKTVVDFSLMSDKDILTYLAGHKGGLCGRLKQSQLNRPLEAAHGITRIKPISLRIAASMALVLGLSKVSSAQATGHTAAIIGDTIRVEQRQGLTVSEVSNIPLVEMKIEGTVTSLEELPLEKVHYTLSVMETGNLLSEGFTDQDGKYWIHEAVPLTGGIPLVIKFQYGNDSVIATEIALQQEPIKVDRKCVCNNYIMWAALPTSALIVGRE
jgi:hypothetical protein